MSSGAMNSAAGVPSVPISMGLGFPVWSLFDWVRWVLSVVDFFGLFYDFWGLVLVGVSFGVDGLFGAYGMRALSFLGYFSRVYYFRGSLVDSDVGPHRASSWGLGFGFSAFWVLLVG